MTREGALTRFFDEVLEFAKRFQRRYHAAAYAELAELGRRRVLSKDTAVNRAGIHSILIFKPDEIGDAVYALPALAALRKSYPEAWIGVLCQRKTAALYERTNLFDEVVGIKVKMRLRRFPRLDLTAVMEEFSLPTFDAGVFLRTYPSYFSFFRKLPLKLAVYPREPRLKWKKRQSSTATPLVSLWQEERPHQIRQMWETLSPLLSPEYAEPPSNPIETEFPAFFWKEEDKVPGLPDRFLAAHPFNDLETKRYPLDQWMEIYKKIRQVSGLPIVILGGAGDEAFPGMEGVTSLQGKLTLAQSGYVLSRATAFLGTSSGPAHLAAILGIPTLGLLSGHTSPEEWRLVHQGLGLRVNVPCSPCHLRTCNRHQLKCLRDLTPERVWPQIDAFVRRAVEGKIILNQDLGV